MVQKSTSNPDLQTNEEGEDQLSLEAEEEGAEESVQMKKETETGIPPGFEQRLNQNSGEAMDQENPIGYGAILWCRL